MDLFINNELTNEITQYLNYYDIVNLAVTNKNNIYLLDLIKQKDLRDLIKIEIYKLHHTYFQGLTDCNQHTILLKSLINRLNTDIYIKEILFYAIICECTSAIIFILQKSYNGINNYLLVLAYKNCSPPIYKLLLDRIIK